MDFSCLRDVTIEPDVDLTKTRVFALQRGLHLLGYPAGPVDGLAGPRTWAAWKAFAATKPDPRDVFLTSLECVTGARADFSTKVGTVNAIEESCRVGGLGLPEQVAYVLATVEWETAGTFTPVREAFYLRSRAERYRRGLRYYPYYGRGYVQLTWRDNYRKYSDLLGLGLVAEPDLALDPRVALTILVHGIRTGTFTGRKLADYVNATTIDFVAARRCINGDDRADEIAARAGQHLKRLLLGVKPAQR